MSVTGNPFEDYNCLSYHMDVWIGYDPLCLFRPSSKHFLEMLTSFCEFEDSSLVMPRSASSIRNAGANRHARGRRRDGIDYACRCNGVLGFVQAASSSGSPWELTSLACTIERTCHKIKFKRIQLGYRSPPIAENNRHNFGKWRAMPVSPDVLMRRLRRLVAETGRHPCTNYLHSLCLSARGML